MKLRSFSIVIASVLVPLARALSPAIAILKEPDSQQVVTGGTATFTITVENIGDVELAYFDVFDELAPDCNRIFEFASLRPGDIVSYDCTLPDVTESFTNIANVTGEDKTFTPVAFDDDTADVVVIENKWDINYQGTTHNNFTDSTLDNEVVVEYVTSIRDHTVELFDYDTCATPVPQDVANVTSSTAEINGITQNLTATVNLIQGDALVNSSIFSFTDSSNTTALIQFCIRLDLMLGSPTNHSVNFHQNKVTLTLDMTQDFEVENIAVNKIQGNLTEADVVVDYDLEVCQCQQGNDTCVSEGKLPPLTQGNSLYVCFNITEDDNGVEIAQILSLAIHQDLPNITVTYIEGGGITFLSVTSVEIDPSPSKKARVELMPLASFFESGNNTVHVEGIVLLQFKGGTTRRLVRMGGEDSGKAMRILQDDTNQAAFGFDVELVSTNDETLEEPKATSSGSTSFATVLVMLTASAATAGLFLSG